MAQKAKIEKVEIFKSDIELIEPFRIAIMEFLTAPSLFIKIHISEGIYGIGQKVRIL